MGRYEYRAKDRARARSTTSHLPTTGRYAAPAVIPVLTRSVSRVNKKQVQINKGAALGRSRVYQAVYHLLQRVAGEHLHVIGALEGFGIWDILLAHAALHRSEEHTSELQSLRHL